MARYRLGDLVYRVKDSVDRLNTELIYYVGGEHFDSRSLTVNKKGIIQGSTIGPAFNTKFKAGDVLLMSRNPHLRKAGMVNFDGICSDVSYIIRTRDENILLQSLIPIIFQSDLFWTFAEKHKKGSTNFFLNWSDFENFEFDLPSLDEQRQLSNVVWSMKETEDSYLNLIEKTDELVKSQFIEMFGDPIINSRNWLYKKLPEVTDIVLGTTPKANVDEYWGGDIKWVTPAELTDESLYISDTERHITEIGMRSAGLKIFPANTVIFSTRAPIGKTAIASCEMCCNQGFKNFICTAELNPIYLYSLLKFYKDYFINLGTGTTFKELPKSRLENVSISIPIIELQNKYETLFKQIDKSKFEIKQALENLLQARRKLINDALNF